MYALLLIANFVFAAPPDLSSFERFLLPMHDGGAAGVAGSVWRVDEVIVNTSDQPRRVYPFYLPFHGLFAPPEIVLLPQARRLAASAIDEPRPCRGVCPTPAPHPGAIIWLEKDNRGGIVAYDRVFEISADRDNHGAIISAVHELSFRTERTTFVEVPFNENFRTTLRMYNLRDAAVHLRVHAYNAANLIAGETVVVLPPAYGAHPDHGVALRPGYGQIGLSALVPPDAAGPLRIVFEPETSGALFWAFASITSNSAQRVTILTP